MPETKQIPVDTSVSLTGDELSFTLTYAELEPVPVFWGGLNDTLEGAPDVYWGGLNDTLQAAPDVYWAGINSV